MLGSSSAITWSNFILHFRYIYSRYDRRTIMADRCTLQPLPVTVLELLCVHFMAFVHLCYLCVCVWWSTTTSVTTVFPVCSKWYTQWGICAVLHVPQRYTMTVVSYCCNALLGLCTVRYWGFCLVIITLFHFAKMTLCYTIVYIVYMYIRDIMFYCRSTWLHWVLDEE